MTPSQEIISRYAHIERVADKLGRLIGVKRLKISQQIKISEMTPGLEGSTDLPMADGTIASVPRRGLPLLAASVCEMDSIPIPFPKSRGELDAMMDRLDEEGFAAVLEASAKFGIAKDDGEEAESATDLAKKSLGTS